MNYLTSLFSLNISSTDSQKKKDIYAFCMGVISQFFWAMSNIQLKTYRVFYPNNFSTQIVKILLQKDIYILFKLYGTTIPFSAKYNLAKKQATCCTESTLTHCLVALNLIL